MMTRNDLGQKTRGDVTKQGDGAVIQFLNTDVLGSIKINTVKTQDTSVNQEIRTRNREQRQCVDPLLHLELKQRSQIREQEKRPIALNGVEHNTHGLQTRQKDNRGASGKRGRERRK